MVVPLQIGIKPGLQQLGFWGRAQTQQLSQAIADQKPLLLFHPSRTRHVFYGKVPEAGAGWNVPEADQAAAWCSGEGQCAIAIDGHTGDVLALAIPGVGRQLLQTITPTVAEDQCM